ncbi:SDR family oxidoreductase [Aquabacterium sp. A7-Y]|uniref:NAD(P)-dependent oxidoreductase n=1 Tax=Aquabacterium sp. A7-Y TaxID=1349605 RepID=UPI00223DB07B|nr:NAD(P)-binding oxidoreductase [Aquabacterium sp. A7-Y]MCW7538070.1 SDR family oxidoreductase [Aquabacterium sp. A7-Y]
MSSGTGPSHKDPHDELVVLGATGGSGRAAITALLAAGHRVTAFSRSAGQLRGMGEGLRPWCGDAARPDDVEQAVRGQDAVIVTLGISESALHVRLAGSRHTPLDVRSRGTRHVIAAMRRQGVSRLVVQTSFGVGATRHRLPLAYRLMFGLLLKPQVADTELQEQAVRASGLDWVIAQPVNLVDSADRGELLASAEGEVRSMKVARRQVGRFLAEAVEGPQWLGRSVALSAG